MDAKTPIDDPFDIATQVTTIDGQLRGHTSDAYWAFIGPFGGATAGVMLRAMADHPERQGDPLALTVNYCAPLARGPFDLNARVIKTNRSSQHWSVELSQNGEVAAFATAVFAQRRPTWSHQERTMPHTTPFAEAEIYPNNGAAPWVGQYQFRFTEGRPQTTSAPFEKPASARSTLWIRDTVPRKVDAISLASMSDAFFARIFHVRRQLVPIGTVSMTVYFHADADDLAAANTEHVLGTADASVFHKSYSDQMTELWSPDGKLLATSQQVTYFKA
ncbi:MAG: acyl-CoA thioesterase [Proteobacteria bacterium SG_bin9]|nr:MAG: acyl-CoA thioesterase [Proteobacteria bacterium SG_bin9]